MGMGATRYKIQERRYKIQDTGYKIRKATLTCRAVEVCGFSIVVLGRAGVMLVMFDHALNRWWFDNSLIRIVAIG